jgi:hypothetical protein
VCESGGSTGAIVVDVSGTCDIYASNGELHSGVGIVVQCGSPFLNSSLILRQLRGASRGVIAADKRSNGPNVAGQPIIPNHGDGFALHP